MSDITIIDLEVGQTAPNFTTIDQAGNTVELYKVLEQGNKVLLVFYPGDDTPGCTTQLCGIRDIYKEYADAGVKVYGVNQADQKSHQKFIDKHGYQFDILVDTGRSIATTYGAIKLFFKNLSTKRGVFLVDIDKQIIYKHWGQQNNQEILEFLKSK